MDSVPASHRDLLELPVAALATVGGDLRPQVSAIWFLVEDQTIRVSMKHTRQKVHNVRRSPGCALFLVDAANPYRYLEIRGDGEISPDDDYVFADQIGAKYSADVRAMDAPGERRVTLTIQPIRVNAFGAGS